MLSTCSHRKIGDTLHSPLSKRTEPSQKDHHHVELPGVTAAQEAAQCIACSRVPRSDILSLRFYDGGN